MENPISKRDAWLTQARPQQTPPDDYDIWTLWGDRACGKSRALIEELLSLTEQPIQTERGLHAPTIAVFVQDLRVGFELLVFGPGGLKELSDMPVDVNVPAVMLSFPNGAVIRFYSFENVRRAEGAPLHHFAIEDADKATPRQLDEIYRLWQMAARWTQTRLIQTCCILPPYRPSFFMGQRRHLSISDTAENTALPDVFLKAAKKDSEQFNGEMTAQEYLDREDVPRGCRWSARRKAAFLLALTRWPDDHKDLLANYGIAPEEIAEWRRGGESGLRATRVTPPAMRPL